MPVLVTCTSVHQEELGLRLGVPKVIPNWCWLAHVSMHPALRDTCEFVEHSGLGVVFLKCQVLFPMSGAIFLHAPVPQHHVVQLLICVSVRQIHAGTAQSLTC